MNDNIISLDISKANKDMKKDKIEKHPLCHYFKLLPSHPFRLLITGSSGSGKTNLLMNLISNRNMLYNYFEKIHIFSPTFDNDDSWETFKRSHDKSEIKYLDKKGKIKTKQKHKKLITDYQQFDSLNEIDLQQVIEEQDDIVKSEGLDKSPKILFIFDDCLSEKAFNSKIIQMLFFRGRHLNSSMIICGQSYMSIPRPMRLQLSNIISFLPSPSEMKRISEDNINIYCDQNKLDRIIMDACKQRYSFIHINKQDDAQKWYRKKFDEIYKI